MANCNKCGFPLNPYKRFCTRCGAKAETTAVAPQPTQQAGAPAQVQCSKCGTTVPTDKRFCTSCGHPLSFSTQSQASSSASPVSPSSHSFKQQTVADVKCAACGATVPADKRFCTTCGKPIETKPAEVFRSTPYPASPPTTIEVKPVALKPEKNPAKIAPPDAPARRPLLRIVLLIGAAVVVAAGLFAVYSLFIRKPAILNDKQLLVNYYGPPPFFTVILAQDGSQQPSKPVRREIWVYPERKVSFVLLGGKYQFSSDLKSAGKSVAKAAGKLRIEQITELLTVDDLSKLVGSKPVSLVNLPKEELADAIRYEYGGGINAVFSQGRLLMVQIMPAQEGK
jgi:rRNA maturation endonuclease Nob1